MADVFAAKSFLRKSQRKKLDDALLPGEVTSSFRRYNKGQTRLALSTLTSAFVNINTSAKVVPCDKAFLHALITRLNRHVIRLPFAMKWTPNQYVRAVLRAEGDVKSRGIVCLCFRRSL